MKVFALVLCLAVAASARMAYRFSDGYLDILGAEPAQTFDCTGRAYGYYADVATDCQVFHVCLPIPDETGEVAQTAHFSFFCGNQTVFSQESLTCTHPEDAFPCSEAETLFELSNADFGRIPEGGDGESTFVPEGASSIGVPAVSPQARSKVGVTIQAEKSPSFKAATEEETTKDDTTVAIPASVPAATSTSDDAVAEVDIAVETEVASLADIPDKAPLNFPGEVTVDIAVETEAAPLADIPDKAPLNIPGEVTVDVDAEADDESEVSSGDNPSEVIES